MCPAGGAGTDFGPKEQSAMSDRPGSAGAPSTNRVVFIAIVAAVLSAVAATLAQQWLVGGSSAGVTGGVTGGVVAGIVSSMLARR